MKIFISSTYSDMIDLRTIAIGYFKQYISYVEAMEIWPASEKDPLDWCKVKIRESDLIIGIYGNRYGSIDEGTGKSLTELEYEEARRNNIPVLAFLIGQDYLIKVRDIDNADNLNKQKDFIERVKVENGLGTFFNSQEEFRAKLHNSFRLFLDSVGVDNLDIFNFNNVWDEIQKYDSQREQFTKIESIIGNNAEKTIEEFAECIDGLEVFHRYLEDSNNKLGDDFLEAVNALGGIIDVDGNEEHYSIWRTFGIRNWEMITFFPNRIAKLKIVYYHLKLLFLKQRIEDEIWTKSLQDEIETTISQYKKLLGRAYYID